MNEEELKRQEEEAERLQREEELRRASEAIATADEMNRDAEERRNGAIAAVAPDVAALKVASDEEVAKRLRTPGRDTSVPVLDKNNNRVVQTKAAPAAAPAKPAQPEDSRLAGVKIINGKSITEYGSKVRMVDQKTKQETWYEKDAKGNLTPISEPQSETQRKMMAKGHTFASLQKAGFKGDAWGAAIAAQRQNENDARLAKSRAYSDEILMAQNAERDAIRKRKANTVLSLGDATKTALAELSGDIMLDPETKTIFGKDGKPVDPRVRVAKDGSYYLWGALRKDALTALNKRRTGNGGSELTHVAAYTPIDKYGNRKKNADGTEVDPMIAVTDQAVDGKAPAKFNHYNLSHIARRLAEAHKNAGNGEGEAVQQEVMSMLGGRDPLGWRKVARPDGKLTYEQQKDILTTKDAGITERANAKNDTQIKVQQLRNLAKELGVNLDEKKLEEMIRHNKAVEEGGESAKTARANKDQAEAAAKELAAVRKAIEGETDEKRKKELRARESQLQSVVDSFAGIGGGGSVKPVSDTERFLSGGDKGAAPAAAPKGQETPAGGQPKDGAGQASQTAVKKQEPAPKPTQKPVSAPATQGAGEKKGENKANAKTSSVEKPKEKPAPLFDPNAADPFHGLKSRIMNRLRKSDQEGEARRFEEMKSILNGTYHNGDITQGDIEKAKSYFKSKGVNIDNLIKKSKQDE